MEDKLKRMKALEHMIDSEKLEQGVPVRDQLEDMENEEMFQKLRKKTLKGREAVLKKQEEGEYVKEYVDDQSNYRDIAEAGLTMEDKERLAAEKLAKKRSNMGLE